MNFQWIFFLINILVVCFLMLISKFIGKLIPIEKRWLCPLFYVGFVVICSSLSLWIWGEWDAAIVKDNIFWFDIAVLNDVFVVGYFVVIILILFYLLVKLLFAWLCRFIKKIEPFYAFWDETNNKWYLYQEYHLFNYFFKVLFYVSFGAMLGYSCFRFDAIGASLVAFTLFAFELKTLFPIEIRLYNETPLIDINDPSSGDEPYKNNADFDKFYEYVKQEFYNAKSKKCNSVEKIRVINNED